MLEFLSVNTVLLVLLTMIDGAALGRFAGLFVGDGRHADRALVLGGCAGACVGAWCWELHAGAVFCIVTVPLGTWIILGRGNGLWVRKRTLAALATLEKKTRRVRGLVREHPGKTVVALVALGLVALCLTVDVVGYHALGGVLGAWCAAVIGSGSIRRDIASKASRWRAVRLPVAGAAAGITIASLMWGGHVAIPGAWVALVLPIGTVAVWVRLRYPGGHAAVRRLAIGVGAAAPICLGTGVTTAIGAPVDPWGTLVVATALYGVACVVWSVPRSTPAGTAQRPSTGYVVANRALTVTALGVLGVTAAAVGWRWIGAAHDTVEAVTLVAAPLLAAIAAALAVASARTRMAARGSTAHSAALEPGSSPSDEH